MKNKCDMCLMPFNIDTGVRDTENFCSFCHHDGKFSYSGDDLNEFKKISYEGMRRQGMGKLKAKFFTWMIGLAPYWKDKK